MGGNWQNPVDASHFFCYNACREKIKMSIKIALLKSGETIISDAKELISEEKVCGYLFEKPHKIDISKSIFLTENRSANIENTVDVLLSPWIMFTLDDKILVPHDWVVTIVEPVKSVIELYEEKVNGKASEVSSVES